MLVSSLLSSAPGVASPFAYVTNDLDSSLSVVDVPSGAAARLDAENARAYCAF